MTNNIDSNSKTQTKSESLTPINHPEIQHIIDHINEEHAEDLADLIGVFHRIDSEILQKKEVELVQIYTQGFDVRLHSKEVANKKTSPEPHSLYILADDEINNTYFIGFESIITDVEDLAFQYILLKQKADKIIGKKTIKLTDKFFEVIDSYYVTDNMYRLVLSPSAADVNNPHLKHQNIQSELIHEAGYAYLFDLATFNLEGSKNTENLDSTILRTPNNDSEHQKKSRQHRYYTLRKAWQDKNDPQKLLVWIDIYIHGDTSGARWALNLMQGNIVKIKREIPEKLAHLNALGEIANIKSITDDVKIGNDSSGPRNLLIADETSIPTVARLLELWQQPTAPIIIFVTQDLADQNYLEHIELSEALTEKPIILKLQSNSDELDTLADRIDDCLGRYLSQHSISINEVWGALEANVTKRLRRLLQQRLGLTRSEIVIKVYWRR